MSLTKTGIVLAISTFYICVGVFLSFMDLSNVVVSSDQALSLNNESSIGFLGNNADIGLFSFIPNLITNISVLPAWLNTVLFAPLVITLLWLLISSLPTLNGGG